MPSRDRSHLTVVRSHEEDHAAKTQALIQISQRVPNRMQRVYDWTSDGAENLFDAMNKCVAEGMIITEIEDMLDMPGLRSAYLDWLGRQDET